MSIIRSFQILQTLDYFIRRKATGSREQFAHKLNMSSSALNGYLREMKILGFPVAFDKLKNSYYYSEENEKVAAVLFSLEPQNRQQLKECTPSCPGKDKGTSLYYFCTDPETGKRSKSVEPC